MHADATCRKENAVAVLFIDPEIAEVNISSKWIYISIAHADLATCIFYIILFNEVFGDRGNNQDRKCKNDDDKKDKQRQDSFPPFTRLFLIWFRHALLLTGSSPVQSVISVFLLILFRNIHFMMQVWFRLIHHNFIGGI